MKVKKVKFSHHGKVLNVVSDSPKYFDFKKDVILDLKDHKKEVEFLKSLDLVPVPLIDDELDKD